MLGGEINDEEVEAEQSVELQAGRLQNRGQRDLRAATIAMSQAEKLLTGANTADALVAERAAVTALQRAFSRDRYILRALATRSQLDPARRLTGSLAEATGLAPHPARRAGEPARGAAAGSAARDRGAGCGRRSRTLRPLAGHAAVSGDPVGPALAGPGARACRRSDPHRSRVRAAADRRRPSCSARPTPASSTRSKALTAAAAAAAAEARRAQAEAPLHAPSIAPALSGAFADALRRGAMTRLLRLARRRDRDRRRDRSGDHAVGRVARAPRGRRADAGARRGRRVRARLIARSLRVVRDRAARRRRMRRRRS